MNNLRPVSFNEIIGQDNIKKQLSISIASAKVRQDVLGHTLLFGGPGTGKTTIARAIANEVDGHFLSVNGANLRNIKNLLPILFDIKKGSILFIDEIHRMTRVVEDFLLPCIEDFTMHLSSSESLNSYDIPKFTLIGATTEPGAINKPLLDRFKIKHLIESYTEEDMRAIAISSCKKLNITLDTKSMDHIVMISRFIPRVMNAQLEWIRDYLISKYTTHMKYDSIFDAMEMFGIDKDGMMLHDLKYIECLRRLGGGPIGLSSISNDLCLDNETVEFIIEPWLVRRGILAKTPRGRVLLI